MHDEKDPAGKPAPHTQLDRLLALVAEHAPLRTAIVHPCDAMSLGGAMEAYRMKLIVPLLIGPAGKIAIAAEQAGEDLSGVEIIDTPHSHAAADEACRLARSGAAAPLFQNRRTIMADQPAKGASGTKPDPANPLGLNIPAALGKTALQAWVDLGTDTMRFASERVQHDISTQNAMLACTSLTELSKVQADYIKAAQDQYAEQARRMMEMAAKAGFMLAPASRARGYDDVPV